MDPISINCLGKFQWVLFFGGSYFYYSYKHPTEAQVWYKAIKYYKLQTCVILFKWDYPLIYLPWVENIIHIKVYLVCLMLTITVSPITHLLRALPLACSLLNHLTPHLFNREALSISHTYNRWLFCWHNHMLNVSYNIPKCLQWTIFRQVCPAFSTATQSSSKFTLMSHSCGFFLNHKDIS